MKVSGFSFVRNGVLYDYPFLESLLSLLPLCDEVIVAVGASEDDTRARIESLGSPKIRIIPTVWDDAIRTGGAILAQQTNIALDAVTGDWAIYLQADELLHEEDYDRIRSAMAESQADRRVEGLLFSYNHFYGDYRHVGNSRRWYRKEIRIIRPGIGVRSWGDAQGFRLGTRKLRVKEVDASVYHYGWVRPPKIQQAKQRSFHRLWHPDDWVASHVGTASDYNYHDGGNLVLFPGTHPAPMKDRIRRQDWQFNYDPAKVSVPLRHRILDWVERATGVRIGEYRNYEIL